jgi:hypothetical protein
VAVRFRSEVALAADAIAGEGLDCISVGLPDAGDTEDTIAVAFGRARAFDRRAGDHGPARDIVPNERRDSFQEIGEERLFSLSRIGGPSRSGRFDAEDGEDDHH